MNYSEHPGTQMGVQVSPLFIEGFAIKKLKITVTSVNSYLVFLLTLRLQRIEFIRKDSNHIQSGNHHSKPRIKVKRFQLLTQAFQVLALMQSPR
jgi:hypothetical protein